jgi:hypothetical protein
LSEYYTKMGACAIQRSEFESQVERFWDGLPIRSFTPREYQKVVVTALKNEEDEDINFKKIYEKLLKNAEFEEISQELFNSAFKELSSNKLDFYLLLIFLTVRDIEEGKHSFSKISNLLNSELVGEDQGVRFFHKNPLMNFIKIYSKFITSFSLPYLLKTLDRAEEKEILQEKLHNIYSDKHLEFYINNLFDPAFMRSESYISYDYFFEFVYWKLADGTCFRDNLYAQWSKQGGKVSRKETSTSTDSFNSEDNQ